MGVRGLTTYIADNSELYLKPYELSNTYLVVDGNNIASHLYKWMSKSDSAFGGDYDEYYKTVKDFFNVLKKCQVTPIVLFDGGYEKKKVKTVLSRAAAKFPILRSFCRNFSTAKFFPLFLKQTFCDVMEDLGIFCIQCNSEADVEIATVARALACPVLSYDSDFYIYDVLYIPFSSVYTEPVREEDSNGKVRQYVRCSIYDVTNLLNEFAGLDKSLLPIIATLLGNDYVESSIFQKFFSHVIIPKNKNKSYTQNRIHGVLHWLKKENVDSAMKLILSHLENKKANKVLQAINTSIDDYTKTSVSPSVVSCMGKLISNGICKLDKKDCKINLPPLIMQLFCKCRIDKFMMDMITLRTYFTLVQVEDVHFQSSHTPSLELIKTIYSILSPYAVGESKPLKLYLTIKNQYGSTMLEIKPPSVELGNVLGKKQEIRLKLLYDMVGMCDEDVETISSFTDTWSLFLTAFVYWVKQLSSSISLAHIHAFLLMATANQIVQKCVGYYRNSSKFMKKKKGLMNQLKDTQIMVSDEMEMDFDKLVSNVTLYECLLVQHSLIPLRKTTEKSGGKGYCISSLHLFSCFQSCLYHIMQLNTLLNHPLPHCRVSDFYSGTLLFNFYLSVSQKSDVRSFGLALFKDAPNVLNVYKYLCELLCRYPTKQGPAVVRRERKKKKKRKGK